MTTLAIRQIRRADGRTLLLTGALCLWAVVAIGGWVGLLAVPGGAGVHGLITYVLPFAVGIAAFLRRAEDPALAVVAGSACTIALALIFAALLTTAPMLGVGVTAAAIGAVLTRRFPAASLLTVMFVSGAYGSLTAFTALPAIDLMKLMLVGIWIGVIGHLLLGRRTLASRITPALVMIAAFILASFVSAVLSEAIFQSLSGLFFGPLYLSALLLVAYGGFSDRTLQVVGRSFALICLLLGAYATLRWVIGPAEQERAIVSDEFSAQYNQTAGDVKVWGATGNGQQLGLWMAVTIPFLIAAAVTWHGRFRIVAILALPVSIIGLLASAQRTAVASVVAGALVVVVLHMLARGFRGPRLGVALVVAMALMFGGIAGYATVVDTPEKRARYGNILTPERDVPFQERLLKWRQVLAELDGRPFGYGLGAGDAVTIPQRFQTVSYINIDNSFLMIAFDQGLAIMGFFIVTMLVLLIELIRHAVWTRGPNASALATAAAGTLVAILIQFVVANNYTAPPILAGWIIVGLGVASYVSRRGDREARPAAAADG